VSGGCSDERSEWQRHVGVGEELHNVARSENKVPRSTPVVSDSTGIVGGYKIEHGSGRVDAHVSPATVAAGAGAQAPGGASSEPATRPPKEF
jgi:hypothetical protein